MVLLCPVKNKSLTIWPTHRIVYAKYENKNILNLNTISKTNMGIKMCNQNLFHFRFFEFADALTCPRKIEKNRKNLAPF